MAIAVAETAARKFLRGGAIAGVVADVGSAGFGLDGLWQLVTGFFADIVTRLLAALAGLAHLLVLPLEALWRWLVTAVADAAGAISSDFDGLWCSVKGFFVSIFAQLSSAVASAAHELVLPLEALWRWVTTTVAGAAGAITADLDGLWLSVKGLFAGIFAQLSSAVASAAHELVLPLEAFWRWLLTAVADAAGAISSDFDGLRRSVQGFFTDIFVHLCAAATSAAHELVPTMESLWRWLQSAAATALPVALGAAAVVLLAALVWLCWPALCAVAVAICKALVCAACYLARGLLVVGTAVAGALSCLLPQCVQCCGVVTMRAPGAAGMLISRAAFEATPMLYFQILRTAGAVVAGAVFCTRAVAAVAAAPVAALFRVPLATLQ
ncbi:hypothetical protein ACP4OV_028485 [Aristida adscensionis]